MPESSESHRSRRNLLQELMSRPTVAIALAIAILAAGYGDLVRGGLNFSAALLTLGYVIFVPVAIMAVPVAQQRAYRKRKE